MRKLKQICKRGHDTLLCGRRKSNGECVDCRTIDMKVNGKKYQSARIKSLNQTNNGWKQQGITNPDGSEFTTVDHDRLYQIQQGSCAICKKHSTEFKRALQVDHDHKTGFVRGLLCVSCNVGLGHFKDSKTNLQDALNYLTR